MPAKREMLANVFREFGDKGILDADEVDRAIAELNESSIADVDAMYEILVFTIDNHS